MGNITVIGRDWHEVITAPRAPRRVMLDLETWGNVPGSIVVAVGAAAFEAGRGIVDTFYRRIDPVSSQELGLTMDAATVLWWLNQSEEARKASHQGACDRVEDVATAFASFVQGPSGSGNPEFELWGNGADYDCILWEHVFRRLQRTYRVPSLKRGELVVEVNPVPWSRFAHRCYRTLKSLRPEIRLQRQGTYHNALDDARSQALHLLEIEAALGLGPKS